ncbi:MAG: 5-(carboxyamino)imidazole ribonucleotide synthase [Aquiluna sp.]|nr:5-(carboxyamino)imidazole ribonucleotide synthase [Aquiluna sp.]
MFRVGVIGAGQLARMMQVPAISLGLELRVFAEGPGTSAELSATNFGDYTDFDQLLEFAESVDVVTFDHEHVPTALLVQLQELGHIVRPGPEALIHAQNKLVMRQRLKELGLPQPIWRAAEHAEEVNNFLAAHGPEIIVKTPIGGYDGKGVRVVTRVEDVADWLEGLDDLGGKLLLEQKVEFSRELAQLSARSASGEVAFWPAVETRQVNGVCSEVIAPAESADFASLQELARKVLDGLGVVGVMAVELFEDASGNVFVNELAMRPHNSGHFSIEGSKTSQFEQHLRAVLDLPLGDTELTADCVVMVNLLGEDFSNDFVSRYPQAMSSFPETKFHSYGKAPRPGRKMGHLTVLGSNPADCLARAMGARALLQSKSV